MTMQITAEQIIEVEADLVAAHARDLDMQRERLARVGTEADPVIDEIARLSVAAPSWAVGTGGTRFGRFPIGGEPRTTEEKIDDIAALNALTGANRTVSLHVPWDDPADPAALRAHADAAGIGFDAMNSNTFQDNPSTTGDGAVSYKFGSLANADPEVRKRALEHNRAVIELGLQLGSTALTVWLADGTNHPGQANFRRQFETVAEGLRELHDSLPDDWEMYTEHKPYEPAFYSTVNNDWGSSLLLAQYAGPRTKCLVDLGHHLPNANIEQVVSRLAMVGRLGGFHFNDSKYGDDDLTVGSIHPYQFFLVVLELIDAGDGAMPPVRYMIDASAQPEGSARRPHPGHRPGAGHAGTGAARRPRRAQRRGKTPTIHARAAEVLQAASAATSARSSPRPATATVLPCRRSPRIGGSATAAGDRGGPRRRLRRQRTLTRRDERAVPVVAVDFGASSMRVCRVDLGSGPPRVDVVHRTAHAPRRDSSGVLRWEWDRLLAELDAGLERAADDGPGRVHRDRHVGRRLRPARCTPRAGRATRLVSRRAHGLVPRGGRADRRTLGSTSSPGCSSSRSTRSSSSRPTIPPSSRAAHVVMLPELVVAHLTGEVVAETTSAGTTGLLDLATGNWSDELCDAIALPALLPRSAPPGRASARGVASPCTSWVATTRRPRCSAEPARARRSSPPARGCSSAASSRTPTPASPCAPPVSATSRVRWVVSACCGTSRAGGSWRSAAERGPTTTSTSSSRTRPWPRTRTCSSTRPTSASSRRRHGTRAAARGRIGSGGESCHRRAHRGRVDGGRDRRGRGVAAGRRRESTGARDPRLRRRLAVTAVSRRAPSIQAKQAIDLAQ